MKRMKKEWLEIKAEILGENQNPNRDVEIANEQQIQEMEEEIEENKNDKIFRFYRNRFD